MIRFPFFFFFFLRLRVLFIFRQIRKEKKNAKSFDKPLEIDNCVDQSLDKFKMCITLLIVMII